MAACAKARNQSLGTLRPSSSARHSKQSARSSPTSPPNARIFKAAWTKSCGNFPNRRGSMGITIAYRGRLADLTRIEDFEDRLLDLALELGGQAQIWRSHAEKDPQRMVRGIILTLAPGQESTSLLLAPEGWLISLTDIQDAELGR